MGCYLQNNVICALQSTDKAVKTIVLPGWHWAGIFKSLVLIPEMLRTGPKYFFHLQSAGEILSPRAHDHLDFASQRDKNNIKYLSQLLLQLLPSTGRQLCSSAAYKWTRTLSDSYCFCFSFLCPVCTANMLLIPRQISQKHFSDDFLNINTSVFLVEL